MIRSCVHVSKAAGVFAASVFAAVLLACPTVSQALMNQLPGLALPSYIDESVPDDAVLISTEYARLDDGSIVSVAGGSELEDSELIGTANSPADPLEITDGTRFIPLTVGEAREEMASAGIMLLNETLDNSLYGAYWGSANDEPAFFDADGNIFVYQAKGVIDVSEHNGNINWEAAKNDGVEGVIIRITFGDDRLDYQAARNISECKRLGIPFGVYIYSYAYSVDYARLEAQNMVSKLKELGISPSDLSYPVYYDLEQWTWTGHTCSSDPGFWDSAVSVFVSVLNSEGYGDVKVYSYTSWLQGALNSSYIHGMTNWVAQYGPRIQFVSFGSDFRGWQYTSSGKVNGIDGDVDLNAFGNVTFVNTDHDGIDLDALRQKATDIVEGDYYIKSVLGDRYIDIDNASNENGASALIWSGNDADNQLFHVTPVGNGEYTIQSVSSGKFLDVYDGQTKNGASIIQFEANGGANQRWSFYRTSDGQLLIASVSAGSHNKVLDLANGNSSLGTKLSLWAANGGSNQCFQLQQKVDIDASSQYAISQLDGSVLSVSGDSTESGAGYVIKTGSPARFRFSYCGNGLYTVVNVGPGLAMSLSNESDLVQLGSNGSDSQKWFIQAKSDGYAIFNSAHNVVLNCNSASTVFCAQYEPGLKAQLWQLEGMKVKQGWVEESNGTTYWYEDGVRSNKRNCEIYDPDTDAWYWIAKDGTKTRNTVLWISDSRKWVYYDADGKMAHGEAYLSYDSEHTGWYYFDDITGAMIHGMKYVSSNGGKWVYYDAVTGQMCYGEQYVDYDAEHTGWYLFDEVTGAMFHGDTYVRSSGGKWVRYDHTTGIMVKGLQRFDGSWYYFDLVTGAMAHGNIYVPSWGQVHYFDLVTGRG